MLSIIEYRQVTTYIKVEVYNYSGVMMDEQLNHLIAFLSRRKENIFFE